MKILHRLQAALLRRKLVRQRAQNIADMRAGRFQAKALRREMVRHSRLANNPQRAGDSSTFEQEPFRRNSIGDGLRSALQAVPRPTRRAEG